ncbi:MAG TPA: hypothetical protein VNO20_09875 [Solirubrobacterales bacterium]|nr:hypothetical protein [Solirubrobacterales bacterium]
MGATGPTGPEGPPGEGGGLPNVLTGVWSADGERGEDEGGTPIQASISYLSTVEPPPDLAYIFTAQTGYVVDTEQGTLIEPINKSPEREARCGTGTVSTPDAKPGNLCVFVETESEIRIADESKFFLEEASPLWKSPAPESGAIVPFELESEIFETEFPGGYARGSWAVNTE